jgi:YjbE family integral membrane protein
VGILEILSVQFLTALGSIIILDIVLAGDNAVVIAMASHRLPENIRKKAIYIGTVGAIIIRMIMTIVAAWLLTVPYLQALGGLILIPIAAGLLKPVNETMKISSLMSFRGAVKTIIIADAAMGVDNVLAVAGAAQGDFILVFLGLMISIPIVVWGSQIIGSWMNRYPVLVYAGAGILAWTAGTMILHDKIIGVMIIGIIGNQGLYFFPAAVMITIWMFGYIMQKKSKKQ